MSLHELGGELGIGERGGADDALAAGSSIATASSGTAARDLAGRSPTASTSG
jgi:hypothetical protein